MTCPDIDHFEISDPEVRESIQRGQSARAMTIAQDRLREAADRRMTEGLAAALCDVAGAFLAKGEPAAAFPLLMQALQAAPASRVAFHNLVSALLQAGQFRGNNYAALHQHLIRHGAEPWAAEYRPLLSLPTFLNLEFVYGKCNLKCRMCVGTNSPEHPNRLGYIKADQFERVLASARTIRGVTLSSADSDPLLHPQLQQIIEIAGRHRITLNLFTNGLPLGERIARAIVESQAVSVINFSIDAATEETYARIRGGDFQRLQRNIRMLQDMRKGSEKPWPVVAFSFVAMADNIAELPAFVAMAHQFGAHRVFVEDLIGWLGESKGNHPATDDPACAEHVHQARLAASERGIMLSLPERLAALAPAARVVSMPANPAPFDSTQKSPGPVTAEAPKKERLAQCGWLNGVWVSEGGALQPCCLISDVADMGSIYDGPLHANRKYARVKELLMQGKVFETCSSQRMCEFVQQQATDGTPLRFITDDELGELRPRSPQASSRVPTPDALVSLPVLGAA